MDSAQRNDVGSFAFLNTDWSHGYKPQMPGGCGWYRCYLPMLQISKLGWPVGMGSPAYREQDNLGIWVDDDTRALYGWKTVCLKLVMQRNILPLVPKARANGQNILYDIDDLVDGVQPDNIAYRNTDPARSPDNNRSIFRELVAMSDTLVTSTPFLYEYYRRQHRDVRMIRNGVDVQRYSMRQQAKRPVIGWVGATQWRTRDLQVLDPWLGNYLLRNKLRAWHSGDDSGGAAFAAKANVPGSLVDTWPIVPIIQYPQALQHFDIGLVPLARNDFNEAKSCLKGLEYAASGIPFIATATGEYRWLAEQGIGRLAESPAEWMHHLDELQSLDVRMEEARRQRRIVEDKFTIDHRGEEWRKLALEVAAR
ncbi:MAG TPA: glycosyltransferase [Dyella sp.]|uniref:glycosyltransferase n=1 Tax=Dyella sp. TaxID=1869338 RepID=UPI002D797DD7|nr:glycosyltransferase [Dyella sp.]HET6553626.1 glycosyltransferase [Dyella sp.]